ncbi:hypothetical protein [Algoriphagus yeomjeoni]|uniref:Aerotolerance regulator N-terminal domain-containing protein n=1 Tax=Algoriphagus yeomjeoni TaxID=291403 RepID=A0A327P9R1_9BACT|nr:hypothetical protein [Algoriphagus yeomjeoni]RAI88463.1 hypothetical protein LV83_02763 [Algoriphagus yeomjeoni]
MIHFEPILSWIWAWLFAVVILTILVVQLFWIGKSDLKPSGKAIKGSLNALFSLLLIGYIFQPSWRSSNPEQAVLVYSGSTQKSTLNYFRDSLDLKKSYDITKYKGEGNPVYLLGNDFSKVDLLSLGEKEILWISESEPSSISFLEWKGILRKGEMQTINGRIVAQDSLKISLSQQGELLSETRVAPSSGIFSIQFPASILGRNQLDLMVNDSLYGSINFFTTAAKPIRYSLQFAFPTSEIRFLSQFLIASGENVSEKIDISKSATITSGRAETDSLQFLVIDPAQLKKKSIQEAIADGASVLVMNLTDVANDISSINKALETNFKTNRSTNEESRRIETDLESAPFEFEEVIAQKVLFEKGFAVQQVGNAKVGVSLLGQTFPVKLAGDSLRYQEIWQKILSAMLPQQAGGIELMQPVFTGMSGEVLVNKKEFEDNFIKIESDSVFLQQSLVNPFSKSGSFVSLDSGWISIGDKLEMYSYPSSEWVSLKTAKQRADFLSDHTGNTTRTQVSEIEKKISDWLWLGMFLLVLTLIWLEPKLIR